MMQNSKSYSNRVAVFALSIMTAPLLLAEQVNASQDVAVRNKQIVTEAFDAWAAGGQTFFTDVLSPDVNWKIEGSGPSADLHQGREVFLERAVRPFASRMSKPVSPVSKKVWAEDDHVIINWEGVGVAGDGLPYSNSYAWIFRMQDGKAVEVTAFLDLVPYDDVLRRVPSKSR
ncbi:nuclear transport factor 2 family protein [Phyllobacterium sp. SB3]|uniref:nuclear transport factor 2 family protein n=1 Tax=Phyllobacterium sp. SB3 TaxID=3156073 RepID=UPI0032AFE922